MCAVARGPTDAAHAIRSRPQNVCCYLLLTAVRPAFVFSCYSVSQKVVTLIFGLTPNSTLNISLPPSLHPSLPPPTPRYFVNFTVDTVVGVFICFGLLKLLECAARKYQWTSVVRTGDYGDPPKVRRVEREERAEGRGEGRGGEWRHLVVGIGFVCCGYRFE